MTFDEFKKIFNEERIVDDKVIQEKWDISAMFIESEDLDPVVLRQSIHHYIPAHHFTVRKPS